MPFHLVSRQSPHLACLALNIYRDTKSFKEEKRWKRGWNEKLEMDPGFYLSHINFRNRLQIRNYYQFASTSSRTLAARLSLNIIAQLKQLILLFLCACPISG